MNIKKIIQEEMDDLDWVKDTSYEHYVGTEFWNAGSGVRIPFVISDVDKDGQVTIKHGDRVIGHKPIKDFLYGVENGVYKLVKESDDFGWMKGANTLSNEYLKGKALGFVPVIKDQDTLDKILKVLKSLGFSHGGWAYEMEWDYDHIEGMYFDERNQIIWTGWINEDYQEHISEYVGRPVEVLNGWSVLGGVLNENFEWVKEIDKYAGPLHGVKFIRPYYLNKDVHTIYDDNRNDYVIIYWRGSDGVAYDRAYDREKVQKYLEQGRWEKVKSDINEDFDWVETIPVGPDLNKKMSWKEMVAFLEERFEGTRFFVSVNTYDDDEYPYISIEDETGTYEDWYGGEVTTLGQVVDGIKETCEDHGSEDIRLEYCELYDTIIGYLK